MGPRWGGAGAGDGGDGGSGGGLYNAGSFDVTSCTMVLNQAGAGGCGGDYFQGDPDSGFIETDRYIPPTASGGASGSGGGIMNDATNMVVSIRDTLIGLNETNAPGVGGSNYIENGVEESIGEDGALGNGPDVGGDFTSAGYNLIGAADGSTGFTNHFRADLVGSMALPIDPLLGPLQMNGGPTPTHALLAGSPAINQGNCFGIHEDQRGWHRPFRYPGIAFAPGGDGSDIGAFELDTLLPPR